MRENAELLYHHKFVWGKTHILCIFWMKKTYVYMYTHSLLDQKRERREISFYLYARIFSYYILEDYISIFEPRQCTQTQTFISLSIQVTQRILPGPIQNPRFFLIVVLINSVWVVLAHALSG